ncbi:MAG: tetratricopeptide repeat protein [Vicinamibacterales bacterium]
MADADLPFVSVFHELAALPVDERNAQLDQLDADDPDLGSRIRWIFEPATPAGATPDVSQAIARMVDDAMSGPAGAIAPGATVGPYCIADVIGRGGMGCVFLAERAATGQQVALKVMSTFWASARDHERFMQEQRLLSRLNHPTIAQFYDAGVLPDGTPWFSMEYVRGGLPLTEFATARALDLRTRLSLFREVCAGVHHAHQHAVVHRDLKPSNILVGSDGRPKLVDFGIAKVLEPGDVVTRTHDVQRLTPAYAAPEQLEGAPVGLYTDVYGLGLVLFELLAGVRPFAQIDHSPMAIWSAVTRGMTSGPSSVSRTLELASRAEWRELDLMCLMALRTEPGRRYASVQALVDDLDRFLAGLPLRAHPDAWTYRSAKFIRRHRPVVVAGLAALIVLASVSATYSVRLQRERAATLAEAARATRVQAFIRTLLTGDESDVGPSQGMTVRTLLDRGALAADSLATEPLIQADVLGTIGAMYAALGDVEQAERLLQRAHDLRVTGLPADDAIVIGSLVDLALLKSDLSDVTEARRLSEAALARAREHLDPTHPVSLRATLSVGKAATAAGDYAGTITLLDPVVRTLERTDPDGQDRALALGLLANAHHYAGHLDEAERLHRVVIDLDRRLNGSRHPAVAHDLLNLADLAVQHGRDDEAAALEEQAATLFEGWYSPDHPEVGSARLMLAGALRRLKRYDEAVTQIERARAIFERAYPDGHRRLGMVDTELGALALERGDHEVARAAFERALSRYRRIYPDGESQYISVGLANLGSAYLAAGDNARAEAHLAEALALSTRLLSAEHLNTATASVKLGRARLRLGRLDEALPLLEAGVRVFESRSVASTNATLVSARADAAEARSRLGGGTPPASGTP